MFRRFSGKLLGRGPILELILKAYPALTAAASLRDTVNVKLSTTVILIYSGVMVSTLHGMVPSGMEVPYCVIIVTNFMAVIRVLIGTCLPTLGSVLNICLPLVIIGYVVLNETRTFTNGGDIVHSTTSNLNVNVNFAYTLVVVNNIERLLNTNGLLNFRILPRSVPPVAVFMLTPNNFFIFNLIVTYTGHLTRGGNGPGTRLRSYNDYPVTTSYDLGSDNSGYRGRGGRTTRW